jgi:hypothetical protein
MGQIRDHQIREFKQRAGIESATGRRAELLEEMKREAAELIEVVVLEETGLRDGDGYWSGCSPLEGIIRRLNELMNQYSAAARGTADKVHSRATQAAQGSGSQASRGNLR